MDSPLTETSSIRHTYRQRPQQRPARDTQTWTTTRCHRLLRPLKTHIFALRREVERENSETLKDDESGDGSSGTNSGPASKQAKYQHTYSRRGRKLGPRAPSHETQPQERQDVRMSRAMTMSRKKALQPGEIVLPTPVIRRARQQVVSPMQRPALDDHGPKMGATALDLSGTQSFSKPSSMVSALETELLPLRHRISPTRFSLYESILRALHALLIATASMSPVTSSCTTSTSATKNHKSLIGMCLRKVPEYIGELEYWEQRDAEEKGTKSSLRISEVSNQVYEAVEDMLPSARGCSHLRIVVREHGMRVIRNAVLEGVLDDHFSLLLVALCYRTKAFPEAEGLLEVILDRNYPKPKGAESTFDEARTLAPLKTLRDLARECGRSQFMLRQLSKLMKVQQLPLEWLSTKQFASIWSGIVNTLTGDAACDSNVSCAVHMITLLSAQAKSSAFTLRPDKGDLKSLSQQTLISVITALASICLLRQGTGVQAARRLVQGAAACDVSTRIRYIIEACMFEIKRNRKSGWISTVLKLSAYLLGNTQTGSTTDAPDLWHRMLQDCNRRDGKRDHEAAIAFLCSLARCCGQGAAEPSHFYLINFCDQLDSMASVEGGKSRQMRTDCAFLLAERTNDMRDLAFAECSSNTMGSLESKTTHYTPNKGLSTIATTGFRWDGDISEWVTATPAPRPRRSSTRPEEWSRGSVAETCADETASDSGISAVEATSAKPYGSNKETPRRWTRSSATRANRSTQRQGSALAPSRRKRTSTEAGLSSEYDAEEEEAEDEDDTIPRPRRYSQYRARGQENRTNVKSVADAKKRRRVGDAMVLKPRRAMLRTITNTGHADLSDDELGL